MKRSLTQKQYAVLEFIQNYFLQHRRSPLIREIQAGCQITSYKSAIDRLNALEHKKLIRRVLNKHRGIRLIHQAVAELAPDAQKLAGAASGAAPSMPGGGAGLAAP